MLSYQIIHTGDITEVSKYSYYFQSISWKNNASALWQWKEMFVDANDQWEAIKIIYYQEFVFNEYEIVSR